MASSTLVPVEDRRLSGKTLPVTVPAPSSERPSTIRLTRTIDEPWPGRLVEHTVPRWLWLRLTIGALGLFIFVLSASLLFLAIAPSAIGYRPVVVSSGSMAPALRTADVVLTEQAEHQLAVGTVIDFRSDRGNVIHRIVEVTDAGYRTKGDAAQSPDSTVVAGDDIEGVGVMVVPLAGLPQVLLAESRWLELIGLSAALGLAGVTSSRRWVLGPADSPMLQ